MQKSWRTDSDKCTFIILDRQADSDLYNNERMIGDVNFYLNNTDNPHEAELEVMVAEEAYTGKGIATEVLKLMMHYAINDAKVDDLVVRIKDSNAASIHIFESTFGFVETERSKVFQEVTLRRKVSDELVHQLAEWTKSARRVEYRKPE
ncbi:N-acetyltransferase 9 [Linderina pennispora]|nr:N-acetyltransferase 9 [Linderina pennispora]